MYINSLPDHSAPGFDEAAWFSKFQKHNIIVNAVENSSHCDDHTGCLSIKTILHGEEWYGIDQHRLALRPGQYLILNDDQSYSCHSDGPLNCLSIFFKKDFASAVLHDMLHSAATQLDEPAGADSTTPSFYQTLNPVNAQLHNNLTSLIAAIENKTYDEDGTEEQLIYLLRFIIGMHQTDLQRRDQVNALKASTRQELYKRVCVARDVLHSSFTESLDLNKLGQLSCLSVPQLVRQFRAAFQTTPYQYLIRVRLQQAAQQLLNTPKTVAEISWYCGFEDSSAFCRAFRSTYGVQPLTYRNLQQ